MKMKADHKQTAVKQTAGKINFSLSVKNRED